MVNDDGQLYTIEGIAASVLILTTVYLVLSSTLVLTPAETHIYDMQLEQLGNDVLAIMDMSPVWIGGNDPYPKSPLEIYIEDDQKENFTRTFLLYSNQTTGNRMDDIQFSANVTYREGDEIKTYLFTETRHPYRENAVKVTRWANVDMMGRNQTVLLEVLLWRG